MFAAPNKFNLFTAVFLFVLKAYCQQPSKQAVMQGKLTPLRQSFDVTHYDIHIKVDPQQQTIAGSNQVHFKAVKDLKQLQIDLWSTYTIDSIVYNGIQLESVSQFNAYIITLPSIVAKGKLDSICIYYHGKPPIAQKAPWDGGFVWSKDVNGKPWVGLACESLGASSWLPCKDHWSDEPDSINIHLEVPEGLIGVCNGQFVGKRKGFQSGWECFEWKTQNPINAYNISINIGDYVLLSDNYRSTLSDTIAPMLLNYYVLRGNEQKAETHFKQVSRMLDVFAYYVGDYPFWHDGYKLVQTPYWGMEHQSCIAYGNQFENNEWGFDFIIVHESGHEWFGNNITASDPADMWIHESFTTYLESLFVERTQGKQKAIAYLNMQKQNIKNKQPLVGPYGQHYHGRTDNDIYYKGAWMLHSLRTMVDNDSLFINMLRDVNKQFRHKQVSTQELTDYISMRLRIPLNRFFNQYLYQSSLPVFEYVIQQGADEKQVVRYRWANAVNNFDMPVYVTVTKNKYEFVTPTKGWQVLDLNYFDENDFKIDTTRSLIQTKRLDKLPQ
ncbi:MAG: M1 family metallopeptidase [Bacteroidia bacterium]|jgi:aminopeptidase N|nr:M1 family metallopeptidase [Bacteroidia bacterium]